MSSSPPEISQISHSAVSRIATPRIDFEMALAVRHTASRQAVLPKYLLEPEITLLLAHGFPDLRHRMFFDVLWNTGARLSEALALTPKDIHTGERWPSRPFVSLMTLKQQGRPGRPPKDTLRDVPLFDEGFTLRLRDYVVTFCKFQTKRLWSVTDDTIRNWLSDAVTRCEREGLIFSVPVTPHTFRHSYAMHLLYCGADPMTLKTLLGHRDFKSTQVYLDVMALEATIAGTRAVRFGMSREDAAALILNLKNN
ncbi:TPA: tyrosine-type recombinase/integrase [Klebsiella pneumoniae]|nr:phage integrase family protein [Salmonella enterica subsp. enterica serovar Typhimurium]EGM8680967.1 tyrosine-type recombinase/integrase [Escherichia coli]HCM7782899.1 tyrosine-type recombinase/integrase [Klebsiella pneumoniae]